MKTLDILPRLTAATVCFVMLGMAALAPPAVASAPVTVTATISVGSYPLGAAVDPRTKTVYIVNEFANTVSVISEATNRVKATIAVPAQPLFAAAASALPARSPSTRSRPPAAGHMTSRWDPMGASGSPSSRATRSGDSAPAATTP
jgi:YVTN family beta-propeller protein